MADLKFPLTVNLAGVTQYQPAIISYYRYRGIRMTRQPENKFDANAIAIHGGGQLLGYIPAWLAKDLAPMIDAGQIKKPKFICKNISSKHDIVGVKIKIERK